MYYLFLLFLFSFFLSAQETTVLSTHDTLAQPSSRAPLAKIEPVNRLPFLPTAVTNNAVAQVQVGSDHYLVSLMGLGAGKTHHHVHNRGWVLKIGEPQWRKAAPVPSSLALPPGRLASIAVGVGPLVYLFGGYTVAADGSEVSSPDNFIYDVITAHYLPIANTPIPVDDTALVTYANRYIYLISGWHNDGNVNLVQVYDIKTNRWQQATPFPGKAVFGHASALIDNKIVVCDGVSIQISTNKKRNFVPETACYLGEINQDNPLKIDWHTLAHPTGQGRYRMAAAGYQQGMLFIGGSTNPYNYNGIGYNQQPAEPNTMLWYYDLTQQQWQTKTLAVASMDHRGALIVDQHAITVGGMQQQQQVTHDVLQYSLDFLNQ